MLMFWKKSVKDNKNNYMTENIQNLATDTVKPQCSTGGNNAKCFNDESLLDIEKYENEKRKSRLVRSFQDIIHNKSALQYFVQFMHTVNASAYIFCWLDVTDFKSTTCRISNDHDLRSNSAFSSMSTNASCSNANDTTLCNQACDTRFKYAEDDVIAEESLVEQALSIFKKYIAPEADSNIDLDAVIRNQVMENICTEEKVKNGTCFEPLETALLTTIEQQYMGAFLNSEFYVKHRFDVFTTATTTNNVALGDLLNDETALFYFMEFLDVEQSKHLLEFWIAATNFQRYSQLRKDAVILYEKYFSLEAMCPLRLCDKIRVNIEEQICNEEANNNISGCFHMAIQIVEQILERDYLHAFLQSELFTRYLAEILNTFSSCPEVSGFDGRTSKGSSDCGSDEHQRSNSFLALEIGSSIHKSCRTHSPRDLMVIENCTLSDPNALWRRKKWELSCGRVSELGKFETYLAPEPDRNQFKLSDVVRKIVHFDDGETKKKEDLAWQVAEMIVKDITNVTLGSSGTVTKST